MKLIWTGGVQMKTEIRSSQLYLQFKQLQILTVQINLISRLIPITGKDKLDKLVCSQHMGLRNSDSRELQRWRRGHLKHVKAWN